MSTQWQSGDATDPHLVRGVRELPGAPAVVRPRLAGAVAAARSLAMGGVIFMRPMCISLVIIYTRETGGHAIGVTILV